MNNTTEINELNRVINSLTCQIKGIAEENDSLHDTINEQHAQINSLTARVWDAECKVIKISDIVDRTDPYYRSTVTESIAVIVADIPVGSAIQKDGVAAELDSLRTNSEKWEREAHRLMEVITGNANDIERLTTKLDEKNAEISELMDIYAGMRAALDNQGRTRNNKIAEQKATIEELETANESGRSAHQRLYQQNHNLVVMAEARNDRIAELESENDDLSRNLDVLPTNFWSVIGERDATIKQQKITIASLGRDLIEESKCNDEECACLRGVISRLDADNIESRRKFANLKKRDAEHIDHLNATIFKQNDTIQCLRSTVDKKNSRLAERNNDEEWWAQECESLKDTIVSHEHTIDKLKTDRDEWKLSLCDACDVIRRFKESS